MINVKTLNRIVSHDDEAEIAFTLIETQMMVAARKHHRLIAFSIGRLTRKDGSICWQSPTEESEQEIPKPETNLFVNKRSMLMTAPEY